MKLPRDLGGHELAKLLSKLDYQVTRQSGSHLRLETELNGRHCITIPAHPNLRIGTLNSILIDVAQHHKITKQQLLDKIIRSAN